MVTSGTFAGAGAGRPRSAACTGPTCKAVQEVWQTFHGVIRRRSTIVVEAIEQLRWEAFVFVRAGKRRIVARAEGEAAVAHKVGAEVVLDWPADYLHLFAEDGASLRAHEPPPAAAKQARGA